MHEGLKIQDLVNIALAEYHRLPQHPVFKQENSQSVNYHKTYQYCQ